MNEWSIKPSYKLDLASFSNLYCQNQEVIEKHQDGYERFKEIIEARQDLVAFAKSLLEQGIIIGVNTATILSLVDYDGYDIDEICRILDDETMHPILEKYVEEQNLPYQIYEMMLSALPFISDLLHYTHHNGFYEYWLEECLPAIQAKCIEFEEASQQYPIITEVNNLLGFESIQTKTVTLYLCSFNAPHGVGLKNAFISDIRWQFDDTVAVAVHELIHPPFSRKNIKKMTDLLWDDEFIKEGKERLPAYSYHLPEEFIEENLVEGTHIYLSEKLGVEKDPLKYLIDHDNSSHVVSVILYDALKKGYREQVDTIEQVVEKLILEGSLKPGNIRDKYKQIYEDADMGDDHPFQADKNS